MNLMPQFQSLYLTYCANHPSAVNVLTQHRSGAARVKRANRPVFNRTKVQPGPHTTGERPSGVRQSPGGSWHGYATATYNNSPYLPLQMNYPDLCIGPGCVWALAQVCGGMWVRSLSHGTPARASCGRRECRYSSLLVLRALESH